MTINIKILNWLYLRFYNQTTLILSNKIIRLESLSKVEGEGKAIYFKVTFLAGQGQGDRVTGNNWLQSGYFG